MIPELGHFTLILALAVAFVQAIIPGMGFLRRRADWMAVAKPAALLQFALVLSAYGILTYSFIVNDFSVLYAANTSNSELPLIYRISGVWGAHEGSLLLWVLILSTWTAILAMQSKKYPVDMSAGVISVLGFISIGFILFSLFTSNPFLRHFPAPVDGGDLNPLLQDPVMAIHPPMLYMGYVGFAIPFAFAIAALVQGKLDTAWARWVRPWALIAWVSLTAGITLGSWWAYYELGWGGWWFWDPVENASFMPWLTGTALIHSLAVTEKRHALRNWTVLLAIISFSLSLLGTFLVRSGVLTSVHAFASDPTRGVFILVFLGLVVGISLGLFAYRAWQLRTITPFSFVSREMALLTNSVFLLIIMLTVLLGTLYPLILEALGGGKISVGPPYFSRVFIPLMIPVVILMAIGPFIRWRQDSVSTLTKQLRLPAILAVIFASVISLLLPGKLNLTAWFALLLAFWVFNSCYTQLKLRLRNTQSLQKGLKRIPRGWYGMIIAHIGIAFTVVGIALSSVYSQEQDVHMVSGDDRTLGDYRFEFVDVERKKGPNYQADVGTIQVYKNDKQLMTLHPEKRIYNVRKNMMTEAAINTNLLRDLYVSLGEQRNTETGAWSVRLYYKPFILWIWLGGFVMILGGLIAVTDKRYRIEVKQENIKLDDKYVATS
ncbi:MAG: heme lyase CcmF/NrfE family subunit [Proteobacteria bacterium]|nr:heme lyase CcmF/NrfE family subunit [Pseudomonadota bacterium]NOG59317.1 heme lyase CcmF/NrfE family subunit [Pseudomonadota bacterium]